MAKLDDQIAKAAEKLKQLKAEAQRIEARKRAAEQKRTRQEDNHRKMLVGAVVLAKLDAGEYDEAAFRAMMDAAITKPEDRKLFDLPIADDGAQATPAPVDDLGVGSGGETGGG